VLLRLCAAALLRFCDHGFRCFAAQEREAAVRANPTVQPPPPISFNDKAVCCGRMLFPEPGVDWEDGKYMSRIWYHNEEHLAHVVPCGYKGDNGFVKQHTHRLAVWVRQGVGPVAVTLIKKSDIIG
jgi:hypothetical protein